MSRIVNLKTVRFNIFNVYDSWYSSWYEDINYSSILHEDLMLKNYLIGIFYKLKVPTNYFFIKRTNNNLVFISTDLFFTKYYKKSLFKHIFKEQIYYFSFLIKLYSVYKNYYYYHYFSNGNIGNFDLFFSNQKIRQITFIGSSYFFKLKNSILKKNNTVEDVLLFNLLYNSNSFVDWDVVFSNAKHFFYFQKIYIDSLVFNKFLLLEKDKNIIVAKYSYFFLSFFSKVVLFHSYFFNKLNLFLLKQNVGMYFFVKQLIHLETTKKNSNYVFYLNKSSSHLFINSNLKGLFSKDRSIILFYLSYFFISNTHTSNFYFKCLNYLKYYYFTYTINSAIVSNDYSNLNYLSKSVDYYKSLSIIKYLKLKYYRMSYIYKEGTFKKKLIKKVFNTFFYKTIINDFIYKIENTISNYLKQRVFFICNIFYTYNDMLPSITNAKIITDFLVYNIHNQVNIRSIFKRIRKWQLENNEHKEFLEELSLSYQIRGKENDYINHLSYKRFPIMGIRVECSGTAKKGTRKQKIFYGDWIKDFDQNTKSPNNTFSADLDYYQSFAIVKSSTLGIKVWVFFKTHLYNANNVFISLISY